MKKTIGIVILVLALILGGIIYVKTKDNDEEDTQEVKVEETLTVEDEILNAIKEDDLTTFKTLITDNNMNLSLFIGNNNLLHHTAVYNAFAIAEYLLEQGIIDDVVNTSGNSALELTIINSSKEVFDLLVDNEMINGKKPIYYALNNDERHYLIRLLGTTASFDSDSIKLLQDDQDLLDEVLGYLDDEQTKELQELLKTDSDDTTENNSSSNNNLVSNNNGGTTTPTYPQRPTTPPVTPSEPTTPPVTKPDPVDPIDPTEPTDPTEPPVETITIEITNSPDEMVRAMEDFSFNLEYTTTSTSGVTFSIENKPEFLSFNVATGELSGKPYYTDKKLYEAIKITATTQDVTDVLEFDLLVDDSFIELAMVDGDFASYNVDTTDIAERAKYNNELVAKECSVIEDTVFNGEYQSFDFSGGSNNWINPLNSINPSHIPVVAAKDGTNYLITGEFENGTKYAVSGFRVFETLMGTSLYDSNFSENMVKYLTDDPDFFNSGKTIYTNKVNELRNYFNVAFGEGNYDVVLTNTFSTDVDFVFAHAPTSDIVTQSRDNQIPIMTFYHTWWVKNESIKLFDIESTGYPGTKAVNNFESFDSQCNYNKPFERLLTTYEDEALNLVNKNQACTVFVYKRSCNFNQLLNDDGNSMAYLVIDEINALSKFLGKLDYNGENVYDGTSERMKLSVMLADMYRSDVTYNMSHTDTDDNVFYKAYYADNVINYGRETNLAKDDLGTFAPTDRAAIDAMNVESGTFTFTPGNLTDWYTTGYYLKPGQTLTVKRTDTSSNVTTIHLNMQRNMASRIWDDGVNYIRPYIMRTNVMEVSAGEELTYSSPHGGNIYITVTDPSDFEVITLEFEGVLSYPVLSEFDNASINAYVEELKTTPFKYTDFYTELASVHALKSRVIEGFGNYPGNESQYIEDINDYVIKGNYSFAGYEGDLIGPLPTNVSSYFIDLGLTGYNDPTINRLPRRQHINVDNKVACANLCSGNPYDISTAINPFGHGDNHEMGHNLQSKYLNIYGVKSKETSNNIFPQNVRITRDLKEGQTRTIYPYANPSTMGNVFAKFNADYVAGVPPSQSTWAWSATAPYANGSDRFAVYVQIAHASGGWHNFTKMYINSRLMVAYAKNDSDWNTYKDVLGFSEYTRQEALALSANDFMAITTSLYANKDLSQFYEGFGVAVSDAAKAQITANNPDSVLPAGMYYLDYDSETQTIPIAVSTVFIPFGEDATYTAP